VTIESPTSESGPSVLSAPKSLDKAGGGDEADGRDEALQNYATAVGNGFYQRDTGGMSGKYDNVRRHWEDQITRYTLSRFIEPSYASWRRSLTRVRVLDLGAGAGEGYELLTSLSTVVNSVSHADFDLLPADMLGFYRGVDISPEMVEMGRSAYAGVPKVEFDVRDLSEGLGPEAEAEPYHIYFSSYGSLSHLHDEELERLLGDILEHQGRRAVFVADLLGRYSYEWQCYWGDDSGTDESNMRQYSMSYLYPGEVIDEIEVERFPIRYWGAEEFDEFVNRVAEAHGVRVARRAMTDRSILVGRHMDSGEYNALAKPMRAAVNSLHEFNQRTDLSTLIFDYMPQPEMPQLNAFFDRFQMVWNAVVYGAIEAIEHADDREWLREPPSEEYPPIVQEALTTIRDVVRNAHWFKMGDPRANIIEPQLGYILRNLELEEGQGLGAGHGLLAMYEFERAG
jgi:SAM-dependent methyltransferase